MRSFRRTKVASSRSPTFAFKVAAGILVILLYFVIKAITGPGDGIAINGVPKQSDGANIQWKDFDDKYSGADDKKAARVVEAMKHAFWKYKKHAWGYDEISPVTGVGRNTRNGWGAFIVDSATTLAVMGLWEELTLCVEHIVHDVDFTVSVDLVDPFETTIRYLGALVSLVDLSDAGIIPESVMSPSTRKAVLYRAESLAFSLGHAYESPTGMPYPRVNFNTSKPEPDSSSTSKSRYRNPSIGLARAGSSLLELRTLSRLTEDPTHAVTSTHAWTSLVWSSYIPSTPGLLDAPIDIMTGAPVARHRHWDSGHDSYYEYLLKASLLAPRDRYSPIYRKRFLDAAFAARSKLASRSELTDKHTMQHLFLGQLDTAAPSRSSRTARRSSSPGDQEIDDADDTKYVERVEPGTDRTLFINEMSHLAHFAPGTLFLASAALPEPRLARFAAALLRSSRHAYSSTPTGLGAEVFSWVPKTPGTRAHPAKDPETDNPRYRKPENTRQKAQKRRTGWWATDARFRLRPEYVESLFYGWRVHGEERYRVWAWEAFEGVEKWCRTPFGYAGLKDVFDIREDGGGDGNKEGEEAGKGNKENWLDESESFFTAETLKYLYLTFSAADQFSLNRWVFTTEAHPLRMIR